MSATLQSHPTLCYPTEISAICKPLKSLNIDYFSHVKIDVQNRFSAICNNPDFCKYYYDNKHYNADIHMGKDHCLGDFILWDALSFDNKSAILAEEAKAFGVKHVFTIIEKNQNDVNYFHFASNLDSMQINQFYLANIDLLKLFTLHFKENISKSNALKYGYDLKFDLDETSSEFALKIDESFNNFNRSTFLANLKHQTHSSGSHTNRLVLLHKETNKPVSLTKQQERCMRLLMTGQSAKQIAFNLNISPRTAEHHIAIIKRILGCHNVKELLGFYVSQLRAYGLVSDLVS